MVCLAPIRAISGPAKRGSVTNGMLPMPRTSPSFVADPVVASTNHGSASTVIDEPIDDTHSAATIARIGVEPTRLSTTAPPRNQPGEADVALTGRAWELIRPQLLRDKARV